MGSFLSSSEENGDIRLVIDFRELKARSHQRFSASRKMKDEKNEPKNEPKRKKISSFQR
jgi:hypothetical protein